MEVSLSGGVKADRESNNLVSLSVRLHNWCEPRSESTIARQFFEEK